MVPASSPFHRLGVILSNRADHVQATVQPEQTSSERVDRDIKPALLQAEAQVHSNGIAQGRLGLGVKAALEHGAVGGRAFGLDLLNERHQPIPDLKVAHRLRIEEDWVLV